MEETKKVLEKQLQLLSEQTAQAKDGEEVTRLSQAMCEVSDALSRSEAVHRDTYSEAYRNAFWESRDKDWYYKQEIKRVANDETRKKYLFLLLIQLIQGLAIILHKVVTH